MNLFIIQKILVTINSFRNLILRLIDVYLFHVKSIITISSIVHIELIIVRIVTFFIIIISHGSRSSSLFFLVND